MSLINVDTLMAVDHPITPTKRTCDEVLRAMSGHFDEIYATDGASSIPPETLLKGNVLQALHKVCSERVVSKKPNGCRSASVMSQR